MKKTIIYTFKVKLAHAKRIWRRIEIEETQSFSEFHQCIFDAFDRFDHHLYSFYLRDPSKKRNRWEDCQEITHPYTFDGSLDDISSGKMNASTTTIGGVKLQVGNKFEYLFDFGDCWEHEIVVEKIEEVTSDKTYPIIVESKGKSPEQYPEDEELDEE